MWGLWPGLRAFLGPDSCSPRRFASQRDGQIEQASILAPSPGPDILDLENKLSVRSKVGKGTNCQSRTPTPFLTHLDKLSPKMKLTARHIAEIMTFHSKSINLLLEIMIFPIALLLFFYF